MTERMSGQIVTVAWEDGKTLNDCGYEGCECPDHGNNPVPAGTYVTIRLDEDRPLGLWRATIETGEDQ